MARANALHGDAARLVFGNIRGWSVHPHKEGSNVMNLRLILRLLKRDLDLGPRSPFVIFAVTFPLVMTLVIQLVFGSLLDPEPRFGIVDHGSSQIASAAREVSGISVTDVDTDAELKQLVADHDLDAGIVLHDGFDEELQAGDLPFLGLYIAGESLASDRMILTEIVTDLIRDAAGESSDLDVELEDNLEDDAYIKTLKHYLNELNQENFDFIFYIAGVDIHFNDRLGKLKISDEGIKLRDELVVENFFSRRIPFCGVLGGGYNKDFNKLVELHSMLHQSCAKYIGS